jgi:hypothetical protein
MDAHIFDGSLSKIGEVRSWRFNFFLFHTRSAPLLLWRVLEETDCHYYRHDLSGCLANFLAFEGIIFFGVVVATCGVKSGE